MTEHPIAALLARLEAEAAPPARSLFGDVLPPVMVAWGMGVDSTAMLVEMVEAGLRIDQVLTADTGSEKSKTYAFREVFMRWLRDRGVPVEVVRYEPKDFKNYPPYRTLDENCFTNGTLPSISFGFSSCSQKWKVAPQNKWTEGWAPATECWGLGGRVIKLIGYDAGPRDSQRYAHAEGYTDERYAYGYPLREMGWDREACEARIRRAGLEVPPKSACFMCGAMKPAELHDLDAAELRRIVLMEARAAPRLQTVEGLWRKATKKRPGRMTDYIRDQGLLAAEEVEAIAAAAPAELVRFQAEHANTPIGERPELATWLQLFDLQASGTFDREGAPPLYERAGAGGESCTHQATAGHRRLLSDPRSREEDTETPAEARDVSRGTPALFA